MATRIKLTALEQRILDRVFLSRDGFEPVEDLLAAIGGDRNQFVDALETLEGHGYLSVANLDGSIVVASEDLVTQAVVGMDRASFVCANRIGHC